MLRVGAGAAVQATAVKFSVETPKGTMALRLKAGTGIGIQRGIFGKGKTSKNKEKFGLGAIEVEFDYPEGPVLQARVDKPLKLIPNAVLEGRKFSEEIKKFPKQTTLNDKTVRILRRSLAKDLKASPKVEAAKKTYQNSPKTQKDLLIYVQTMAKTAAKKSRFNDFVEGAMAANYFLSQVGKVSNNEKISRIAMGSAAVLQAIVGTEAIIAAFAEAGALSFASVLGPAGMILGSVATISILLSTGSEKESELSTMAKNIESMFREVANSFAKVDKKLLALGSGCKRFWTVKMS